MFRIGNTFYEGQTGIVFCNISDPESLEEFIEKMGGEKIRERVSAVVEKKAKENALSPRYTCPDEKLSDVFTTIKQTAGRRKTEEQRTAEREAERKLQKLMNAHKFEQAVQLMGEQIAAGMTVSNI